MGERGLRQWAGRRPVRAASLATLACLLATSGVVIPDSRPSALAASALWAFVPIAAAVFAVTVLRGRAGLDTRRVLAALWWAPPVALAGYLSHLAAAYALGRKTAAQLGFILTDPDYFAGAVASWFTLWLIASLGQVAGWLLGAAVARRPGHRAP